MSNLLLTSKGYVILIFKYHFTLFHRLQGLEEQYRKEKEEADQLFEQQRKVIWGIVALRPNTFISHVMNKKMTAFSEACGLMY